MNDDTELLRQYAEQHSEKAFAALVERHVGLVYSAALRKTGDAHLAQDAAQMVFVDLARKARRLGGNVVLAGWLYRSACFAAAKIQRTEVRRIARENVALAMNPVSVHTDPTWAQVRPMIDDALNSLGRTERDAVVLRYLEDRNWREIGEALGLSEDAAQKRAVRALEKLRGLLGSRGVTLSTTSLGSLLIANTVQSVPAGLGASLAVSSLATAASTSGTAALLEFLASAKIKLLAGGAVGVALLIPFTNQHLTLTGLRSENATLRREVQQLDELRADNQRLATTRAATPEPNQFRIDQSELMRLRNEVTLLRNERAERMRQTITSSVAASAEPPKMELKGRLRPRDQWQDRGLRSPESALETIWLALSRKDEQRLKEATLGYYQPEGVVPRVVDSSVTALFCTRALSVSGIQVISSSEGADGKNPGSIHYVSFVLQKEYDAKDRDGKPLTMQTAETWAFQRTEQGEFKMVPSRVEVDVTPPGK